MLRFPFFTFVLLVGLSIIIAKSSTRSLHRQQKRFARNHEQFRMLRHLMGKIIDTESNAIYTIDGQKQPDAAPINPEPSPPVPAPMVPSVHPTREEIACLAACHSCVEDYPIGNLKKRAADNCGPMCDCADSCFRLSIEQVDTLYGQSPNSLGEKNCWWRTFHEMLHDDIPSLL